MRATLAFAFLALLAQSESRPVKSDSTAPASAYDANAPRFGRHWTALLPAELNSVTEGVSESGVTITPEPFNRLIACMSGRFPQGSRAELAACVRGTRGWSKWFPMLVADGTAAGTRYSSSKETPDELAQTEVDTLSFKEADPTSAFRIRLRTTGGATVRMIGVSYWRAESVKKLGEEKSPAWGVTLDVPPRRQGDEDPKLASRICSPTSLAMALEWFGRKLPTAEVAARVLDTTSNLYGNWSANASAAAEILGEAYAVRADGFAEIESEIAAGRPVVISHSWKKGDLTNAPIEESDGHLILVVGFTPEGDVVVNDPAAPAGSVRRVYKRAELFRTWQKNAQGIAYVFRPRAPGPPASKPAGG